MKDYLPFPPRAAVISDALAAVLSAAGIAPQLPAATLFNPSARLAVQAGARLRFVSLSHANQHGEEHGREVVKVSREFGNVCRDFGNR